MKYCKLCDSTKPHSEFYKDCHNRDGFMNKCKDCYRVIARNKVISDVTRMKSRQRTALQQVDPKKKSANKKLQQKVRSGKIQKWPACAVPECEFDKVEAHHPDYDRPFDVIWLCRSHHRLAHYAAKECHA